MGEIMCPRWIEFSRDNKKGGVGTGVEENLETTSQCGAPTLLGKRSAYLGPRKADELPSCPQMCIVAGNDGKSERADKEALNLDPAATEDLNEKYCKEVSRHVACRSNNRTSIFA